MLNLLETEILMNELMEHENTRKKQRASAGTTVCIPAHLLMYLESLQANQNTTKSSSPCKNITAHFASLS